MATIDTWSRTLASLRELEAYARIDTILNEHMSNLSLSMDDDDNHNHKHDGYDNNEKDPNNKDDPAICALQDEIQTLRDEMGSLAEIAVCTAHRNPLAAVLRQSSKSAARERREWTRYVIQTLEYLTRQMDGLLDYVDDLRGHHAALSAIQM